MRSFVAIFAAALIGVAAFASDASARPGGFKSGGFSGGMRVGGGPAFRGGNFGAFRGGPVAFRGGPAFRAGFVGPRFSRFHHGRFHHRRFFVGAGFPLLYAGYPYYDDCLVPQRIWTAYGWRTRWINICY